MSCPYSSHPCGVRERSPCPCPSMVPNRESTCLGLCKGEDLAVMPFCRVWFLVSLGVASWVEDDVGRLLGMCWTT